VSSMPGQPVHKHRVGVNAPPGQKQQRSWETSKRRDKKEERGREGDREEGPRGQYKARETRNMSSDTERKITYDALHVVVHRVRDQKVASILAKRDALRRVQL